MSARTLFDTAPLGALVRYSNGEPQPPARFTKKLSTWRRDNGVGLLIAKQPSSKVGNYVLPDSFTLHEGDFGSGGVVVIVVHTIRSVDSPLAYEVVEAPAAGSVLCLSSFRDRLELKRLAPNRAAAAAWHASQGRYDNPVYREVQPDGTHLDIALEALAA